MLNFTLILQPNNTYAVAVYNTETPFLIGHTCLLQ